MDPNTGRGAVVRELLKRRSALFALILSLVRDFDLAEEAMREAAFAICEQWAEFKPGTDFGAWAARIARDKVSRGAVLLTPEAIAAVEKAGEAEAGWPGAARRRLDRLGGRTRSVLAMRYRDGMSGRRIARRTKTTVAAVHGELSRARRVLARCVEGRPAEGGGARGAAEERFDDLVSQYLDDGLDADGAGELNALLGSRPDCARRFARLSRVHGRLRELQVSLVPAGLSEEQALEAWLAPRLARRRTRFTASIGIAAAALLALVFLLPGRRGGDPAAPPAAGIGQGRAALLVVGQVPLLPSDELLRARLGGMGFQVGVAADALVTEKDAEGRALVVISESTLSSEVGNRLARVPVPLLNAEPDLNGGLRLSARPPRKGEKFVESRQRRIRIADASHPLAAGLSGTVTVYSGKDGSVSFGAPDPASARIVAVTDTRDAHPAIFAYEAGAVVRGETLPARRASFFLLSSSGEAARLTGDGWRLFDAAVAWLAAAP